MKVHHRQPELDDLLARIEVQKARPAGQTFEYDGNVYDRDSYLAALEKDAAVLKARIKEDGAE